MRARRGLSTAAAQPSSAIERMRQRRAAPAATQPNAAIERMRQRRAAETPSLASRAVTGALDFGREALHPIVETVKALPEIVPAIGRQIERLPFTPSSRFGPLGDPTLGGDIIDMMQMPEGARLRDLPDAIKSFGRRTAESAVPSELSRAGKVGRVTGELALLAAPVKGVKLLKKGRRVRAGPATTVPRGRFVPEPGGEPFEPIRGRRPTPTGPGTVEAAAAPAAEPTIVHGVSAIDQPAAAAVAERRLLERRALDSKVTQARTAEGRRYPERGRDRRNVLGTDRRDLSRPGEQARIVAARKRATALRAERDARELAERQAVRRQRQADRRAEAAAKKTQARTAAVPSAAAAPKFRVSAQETADVMRGRQILSEKAGGPLPKGVSDQVDRLRVEYNRTQAEFKKLTADAAADPRESQRFAQAARELGSRLSNIERTTVRLTRAAQKPALDGLKAAETRGQQIIKGFDVGSGFGPLGALIKKHPAVAGATAGGAVGANVVRDDPQGGAGLGILLGLVGAKGVPKLMRLAASEPFNFERAVEKINAVRSELVLTGLAIPKNLATLVGAPVFAGVETKSIRPVVEALRMPANVQAFRAGFSKPIDIGIAGGQRPLGRARVVGRTISAIDKTAIEFLRRGGVPEKRLQELLLREPLEDIVGRGRLASMLKHPLGRLGVMFQRTPFNIFSGGMEEVASLTPRQLFKKFGLDDLAELSGPELRRRRLLTAGTIGAGAAAGELFDDVPLGRLQVAMLTAIMGRRALPFAAAAAATGGQEMLLGTTPLPEFGLNPRQLLPFPGLLRLRDQLAEGR